METAHYWFLFSVLFFAAEAAGANGVGLFFAAFGAFIVGLLLQYGVLDSTDSISQFATFFGSTALVALILWKPLKKLRIGHRREKHHDMIGRTARIDAGGLTKGMTGNAIWSGTTMKARLSADYELDYAPEGCELKIVGVDGATLILAQTDNPSVTHADEQ